MKRLFDVVASGLGLLALSPLFLFVAVRIKLDSPGPVFYRQVRVGTCVNLVCGVYKKIFFVK